MGAREKADGSGWIRFAEVSLLRVVASCLEGKRSDEVNLTPLSRTHETPALIGDLPCVRAKSGGLVVAALEIPIEEQTSLDNFMASKGSDADQAALPVSRFWARQPRMDDPSRPC